MPLLSSKDQEKLRTALGAMTRPVRLLFFSRSLDCDTCPAARQILDELPALSDKITVEEVNVVLDAEKAKAYGVDRAPAVAVLYDGEGEGLKDSRIRFVGAPSGYEFMSLVHAVLLAGGGAGQLSDESRRRLSLVTQPITLRVFTTPT
jgi:alkyl hydroperoxide reductase subunit AhpF